MANTQGVYIGQNTILDVGIITKQTTPSSSTNTVESMPDANSNSNNTIKDPNINKFLNKLSIIFNTNYNKPLSIKSWYIKLKDNLLKIMNDMMSNNIISNSSIKYDVNNFITYTITNTGKISSRRDTRSTFDIIIKELIENTDAKTKMNDFRNLLITNTNERVSKETTNNAILFAVMMDKAYYPSFQSALEGKFKYKGGKRKSKKIHKNKIRTINKTRSTNTYKSRKTRSIQKSKKNITRRR